MSRFEVCRFSPSPDPELVCGICMNVLDEPQETPCRHVFCGVCIRKAVKESSKCPLCRSRFRERNLRGVAHLVLNMINKLTIQCDNFELGCTKLIPLEFFPDHEKCCSYVSVQCKYSGCVEMVLRRDLEEHEERCVHREYRCGVRDGCGLMLKWKEVDDHRCIKALQDIIQGLQEENKALQTNSSDLTAVVERLRTKLEYYEGGELDDSNSTDQDDMGLPGEDIGHYDDFMDNWAHGLDPLDMDHNLLMNARRASPSMYWSEAGQEGIPRGAVTTAEQEAIPREEVTTAGQEAIPREDVTTAGQEAIPREEVTTAGQEAIPRGEVSTAGQEAIPRGAVTTATTAASPGPSTSSAPSGSRGTGPASRKRTHPDTGSTPGGEVGRKKVIRLTVRPLELRQHSDGTHSPVISLRGVRYQSDSSSSQGSSPVSEGSPTHEQAASETSDHQRTVENDEVTTNSDNGVIRRSARLQRRPISLVSLVEDVQIPPSAAYLLDKYGDGDSSSDDDSWTPDGEGPDNVL